MLAYKTALASVFETLKYIGDSDGEEGKPGYEAPDEEKVKKLSENKNKSLKDLDKLIERVILKEMLKK